MTGCADTNGHTLGDDGTIWPYKKGTSLGSTRFGFDVTPEGTWTGSRAFTMAGTGGPDEPVTPGEYTFELICDSLATGEQVSIFRDFTVTVSAGKSTPAVVRDNTWFLRTTNTAGPADLSFVYGRPDDFPLFGDWDGNGADGPGVVRGNTWFLRNSNTTGVANAVFAYGNSTDFPIVGDWDGDGVDTPGVVRGNTWLLRNSNTPGVANVSFVYGTADDFPIVGDWDGNGTDTPGVVRGDTWLLRNSNSGGVANIGPFAYGRPDDYPMAWSAAG